MEQHARTARIAEEIESPYVTFDSDASFNLTLMLLAAILTLLVSAAFEWLVPGVPAGFFNVGAKMTGGYVAAGLVVWLAYYFIIEPLRHLRS